MFAVGFPLAALCGAAGGCSANEEYRVHHHRTVSVLVFDGPLPFTGWRAIVVDDARCDTLPVIDAGNDCLAIVGTHDMTGKDAIFVE